MTKQDISIHDRILGCYLGEALGDAMGYPVEFNAGVTPLSPRISSPDDALRHEGCAMFTDDTQMMLAATEGLLSAADAASVDAEVARAFAQWYADPVGGHRSPGGACSLGCRNLAARLAKGSEDFFTCGKAGGRGCGAAMRSACYGLLFDDDRAAKYAAKHALMTHRSRNAQASAVAVAVAVQHALRGESPEQIGKAAYESASAIDEKCGRLIAAAVGDATAYRCAAEGTRLLIAAEVLDAYRGWVGDEAVAASLFAFLAHPDSYESAVVLAVNSPGDSDSLGAITGAVAGAHLGAQAIPEGWRAQVERREHLEYLAGEVARRRA